MLTRILNFSENYRDGDTELLRAAVTMPEFTPENGAETRAARRLNSYCAGTFKFLTHRVVKHALKRAGRQRVWLEKRGFPFIAHTLDIKCEGDDTRLVITRFAYTGFGAGVTDTRERTFGEDGFLTS